MGLGCWGTSVFSKNSSSILLCLGANVILLFANTNISCAYIFMVCSHVTLLYTNNTELNKLRKNICLRKSEVYVKKTVSNIIEKLVEHGIHCLPCSYTNDMIDLSS